MLAAKQCRSSTSYLLKCISPYNIPRRTIARARHLQEDAKRPGTASAFGGTSNLKKLQGRIEELAALEVGEPPAGREDSALSGAGSSAPSPAEEAVDNIDASQNSISLDEWKRLEPAYAASIIHGRGSAAPYQHPRTHNIPVASIHFRSHFPHLLDISTHFATHAASSLAIPCSRPAYLPTKRTLWTVLRGPFAHKKSQENFERKVHKRVIKAWDADQEVVDRWITYLQLHPVAGVGMRITRWHRVPFGFGRDHEISESMKLENVTVKQQVEDVAKQIIAQEMAAAELAAAQNSS